MSHAAPQTAAIVGGAISGFLILAIAVVVTIVALLRFCCGLPARTRVQYVHIEQIQVSAIIIISRCSSVHAGSPSVHWMYQPAPMRLMS